MWNLFPKSESEHPTCHGGTRNVRQAQTTLANLGELFSCMSNRWWLLSPLLPSGGVLERACPGLQGLNVKHSEFDAFGSLMSGMVDVFSPGELTNSTNWSSPLFPPTDGLPVSASPHCLTVRDDLRRWIESLFLLNPYLLDSWWGTEYFI